MARIAFSQDQLDNLTQRNPGLRVAAAEKPAPKHKGVVVAGPPLAEPSRSWEFTYSGRGLSLNQVFGRGHWSERNKLVEKWHAVFAELVKASGMVPITLFRVELRYKGRPDPDNCVAMIKCLVDYLKGHYVPEDSPKYWRGLSIAPDDTLKQNTYHFVIKEVGNV